MLLDVKPAELSRQAVTQWFAQSGQRSQVQANQAFAILRALYHKARAWGIYDGPNPTDGIKRYRRQSRARFVQPEEMPRLLDALPWEPENIQVFFLLSLLVACRPGEAAALKWTHLRFTTSSCVSNSPMGPLWNVGHWPACGISLRPRRLSRRVCRCRRSWRIGFSGCRATQNGSFPASRAIPAGTTPGRAGRPAQTVGATRRDPAGRPATPPAD